MYTYVHFVAKAGDADSSESAADSKAANGKGQHLHLC